MEPKRHTCIVCKKKKTELKMRKFRSHWACLECISPEGIAAESSAAAENDPVTLKVLNLYAGIGGNRKLWPAGFKVTAIEYDPKIAAEYKKLYPQDHVIVGDAREYLLKNYYKFDFIWSSPPCQSHSRMNYMIGERRRKYVDMALYQQILLLQEFFKGRYVVENVNPYYTPLIEPNYKIDRHRFWSNFEITESVKVPAFDQFIKSKSLSDKQKLMDWLGIYVEKHLYSTGHNYCQVFRNCVHPVIGLSVINDVINSLK